jgi:hypothetical protein
MVNMDKFDRKTKEIEMHLATLSRIAHGGFNIIFEKH